MSSARPRDVTFARHAKKSGSSYPKLMSTCHPASPGSSAEGKRTGNVGSAAGVRPEYRAGGVCERAREGVVDTHEAVLDELIDLDGAQRPRSARHDEAGIDTRPYARQLAFARGAAFLGKFRVSLASPVEIGNIRLRIPMGVREPRHEHI